MLAPLSVSLVTLLPSPKWASPSTVLAAYLMSACRPCQVPARSQPSAGGDQPQDSIQLPRASPYRLHYVKPAEDWEQQALPIGNGRFGAMIMGPPRAARFQFNVDSLWTGGPNPSGSYDKRGFGNYQAFGNLYIDLSGLGTPRDYERTLDLGNALHTTTFRLSDGTRLQQVAFASHPAEVIAVHVSAQGPTKLRGSVRLLGEHGEQTEAIMDSGGPPDTKAGLQFSGALDNGLKYEARVALSSNDCQATTASNGTLTFSDCSSITLYLAAATNYAADSARGYRGTAPDGKVAGWLNSAASVGLLNLLFQHVADYKALFERVDVDFGPTARAIRSQSLDRRIATYKPRTDPELAKLLFQYGRYLLIASSRENGLPANLQGLWNHENEPPWHSDYHTNINIQMNYWLAEPANLPECHLPLFNLLDAMIPECRAATVLEFGNSAPGFTYRTSHNIFGGQGWKWNTTSSAWYALHYFEHYAYSQDLVFLRERAWPYLRQVSEFWLFRLKPRDDGRLVAPNGWSPEHGPTEDGVSYDQQLIWELFTSALAAGKALNLSDPILERIAAARKKLLGPAVGSWGQLQEWVEDRDDPKDHHRHTSHLIGVYPGRQINLVDTPKWARAAEVSLRARGDTGDSRRSWTWPWRCALWARLRKPDCHRMIDGLIEHNLLGNLFTTHPPLQIDGNLGITAGICEMLLQSHANELHLLPAVDFDRWPSGSFRGLKARGGFLVSARWNDRRLREASVVSLKGRPLRLHSEPTPTSVKDSAGAEVETTRDEEGKILFETRAQERYLLRFD